MKVRFCPNDERNPHAFYKVPDYVETCDKCESYYPAAEVEQLKAQIRVRKAIMDRLPFCSDHRDKVAGMPCRECQVELLQKELAEARKVTKDALRNYATAAIESVDLRKALKEAKEELEYDITNGHSVLKDIKQALAGKEADNAD